MANENKINGDIEKNIKDTDFYKAQYHDDFVDKWDDLIDWDGRAEGEGSFFIKMNNPVETVPFI